MKILGWMHRKFKQNNNETQKDISIGFAGQACMDDLQCYHQGSYGSKTFSKAQRNYHRNSFTSLEVSREEEEEEEQENALTELFHGFLAIGTLGTEQFTSDPATPTFSISVDHIAEKETKVTENELRLINDELEKVLGAEARDDISVVSSGRNSHVSAGRNSHVSAGRMSLCSTITLSGKPIESADSNGNGGITCPLQSYLFGSAVGMQETAPPVRKEQRTSLGDLFQKTKQAEESGTKFEKRTEKESEKSAVHGMKKMLKKKLIDSTTAETKLHKILHIFNRKVHPENASIWQQSHKPIKNETKNNNAHAHAHAHASYNEGLLPPSPEDIIIYPHSNKHSHLPPAKTGGRDTAANELWVKTDADYLVLEL